MGTVSHREMRNQSAEVLRRVEQGETVIVTNHGRPVAVMRPVERSVVDDLVERGQARVAREGISALRSIPRRRSSRTTAEILADSRGAW